LETLNFGQRAPAQHATGQAGLDPLGACIWPPQYKHKGPKRPRDTSRRTAGRQPPFGPPRTTSGTPGCQPPQGPPGGPPGGQPQASSTAKAYRHPWDDGAMEGQSLPSSTEKDRRQINHTEFQLWWMINSGAEEMNNPFQRIALCLSLLEDLKWTIGSKRRSINSTRSARRPSQWNLAYIVLLTKHSG